MLDVYNILTIIVFISGYFLITIEHSIKINKTATAIMTAVLCWSLQFLRPGHDSSPIINEFGVHIFNISQVVFFLFGALAIVETIAAHRGFHLLSRRIHIRSKKKLLWVVGLTAFFLSSILDNLTTTVIMITLLRKIIPHGNQEHRLLIGGAVVIAANAGGAWTPIGDVTTTMLWIGGQVSSLAVIKHLFLPAFLCVTLAMASIGFFLKGDFAAIPDDLKDETREPYAKTIFFVGIGSLVFVPVFKILTGLPPFMGMLLALSFMWILTDVLHKDNPDRKHLQLPYVMSKTDISSVFFFLGILLCITALESGGLLAAMAIGINNYLGDYRQIALSLGLLSAVVDNVPLVAAIMGMYNLIDYPIDSNFWLLIAYCAGTGGSILVIGSAAGVAFMGMERVPFFWYVKRIGIPALIGYLAGFFFYTLTS